MKKWIADIREKTADMDKRQTLEYVANYYWYHILIGFILVCLAVLLVYHISCGGKEKQFTCVLINQEIDYERDEKLAEDFAAYSGVKEKDILIDSDYQISYGEKQLESVKESSYEKFFFNWQVGEIDAMIMSESFYEYCVRQGGEFMEEKIPVEETCMKGLLADEESDPVFLMFAADSKHRKMCGLFKNYLCDEVKYEEAEY